MPSLTPSPKKDPVLTLRQRLSASDSKFDAKHAEAEAQAEETTRVVNGFKQCATDSRTQMSFRALTEEDLDDEDGNGALPPTVPIDPQRLAEALGQDTPTTD